MARTKNGFFFVKTIDGGPPAIDWRGMKVATAYHEGAVLRQSTTSGSGVKCAAAGTLVLGVLGAAVPTGHAGAVNAPIYLADHRNMFEVKCLGTGAPLTKLGKKVALAVATILNVRASGAVYTGDATAACRILGFHPDDASGTAAGKRYWVTILPKASAVVGDNVTA